MLQKPNTVFVGKKFNAAGTSQIAGDIIVLDASTGVVIDLSSTNNITATDIQLALVKPDLTLTKSQVINKKLVRNLIEDEYVAKTEASSVIDFTSVVPVVGYRYVVRVIYKDLYEHPGQFTQSYEWVATSNLPLDLATAIYTAVNAHNGARAVATISGDVVTLTAKEVVLNGFGTQGLEAVTPYSQVQMKVVAYATNPVASTLDSYITINGITITTTASSPGKGNKYIVRDREQAALAYKGITYRTTFPIIKPTLNTDLTANYDSVVLEYSKKYQSPDNQYVKETDLTAEIYLVHGATGDGSDLSGKLATWIAS